MARSTRYSDEAIIEAVRLSVSIAGVLRMLGVKPAGGSHFHISKRIKGLGLDTSHFTGRGHNKGKRQVRMPAPEILIHRAPERPRAKPHMLRRTLIEEGRDLLCAECGTGSVWLGRPLVLHVDHVDGDPWNCLKENLRFLCPNCHSQTPTFCRKMSSRNLPESDT